jgi:hypothetical protein
MGTHGEFTDGDPTELEQRPITPVPRAGKSTERLHAVRPVLQALAAATCTVM